MLEKRVTCEIQRTQNDFDCESDLIVQLTEKSTITFD